MIVIYQSFIKSRFASINYTLSSRKSSSVAPNWTALCAKQQGYMEHGARDTRRGVQNCIAVHSTSCRVKMTFRLNFRPR